MDDKELTEIRIKIMNERIEKMKTNKINMIKNTIYDTVLICKKCHYTWFRRNKRIFPIECPFCRSKKWNEVLK